MEALQSCGTTSHVPSHLPVWAALHQFLRLVSQSDSGDLRGLESMFKAALGPQTKHGIGHQHQWSPCPWKRYQLCNTTSHVPSDLPVLAVLHQFLRFVSRSGSDQGGLKCNVLNEYTSFLTKYLFQITIGIRCGVWYQITGSHTALTFFKNTRGEVW